MKTPIVSGIVCGCMKKRIKKIRLVYSMAIKGRDINLNKIIG
jgi:hypothetical protein